jgi:hypothetical protein
MGVLLDGSFEIWIRTINLLKIFFRFLKKAHLVRCPHPSSFRRISIYASFLEIRGDFQLNLFEQPEVIGSLVSW